ncbi:MAG: hypothetical protein ACT4P8_10645 [Betaproteobacteria bacterium]
MKLPGGWRWCVAVGVVALLAVVLWSRETREAQPQASVAVPTPAHAPDSHPDTGSRERPGRDRSTRP